MDLLKEHRAAWLRHARWGVFCHYLADEASAQSTAPMDADTWNRRVDSFDAARLARQLASVNAPYFVLTLGQNSGFFCAPNATYDGRVEERPSRLSRRDLVADLASELRPRGIRLMVYLPCHAPANHRTAVEGLGCTPTWDASCFSLRPGTYLTQPGTDARLTVFQRQWEAIVREWSERWGDAVSGWWIDGCFQADRMYRSSDEPNFASLAAALRAGNPRSIVAFNPGVRVPVVRHSEHEDYTAGEIADAFPLTPPPGCVDGVVQDTAQYHVLTYMGTFWGRGEPRFAPEFAAAITRHLNAQGGALTWDVPISPDGALSEPFLRCLAALAPEETAPTTVLREADLPAASGTEGTASGDELSPHARPVAGTRTVEPRFVHLVRSAAGQTQAQFADTLDVHVRTVVGWERSGQPVRVRTATHAKLTELAVRLGLMSA